MSSRILQGHVMDRLRELPDESVNCIVTSPPYWGLRDYGMPPTAWDEVTFSPMPGLAPLTIPASVCCLGLEPTPEEFVGHIVSVFREARRVLRSDGVCWVNLGDSYAGSWGAQSRGNQNGEDSSTLDGASMLSARQIKAHPQMKNTGSLKNTPGLKPKDLIGIPWRVAFALQADGWYLRMDNIWSKPNPMPESVRDRTTKAHEYVFHFAKSETYAYDFEAIKEVVTGNAHARGNGVNPKAKLPGKNSRVNVTRSAAGRAPQSRQNESFSAAVCGLVDERNKRSVWTVATRSYPEAHFATYPEALIEPCILAGCPEGGVVLDPFGGSGTTAAVAERLGRDSILIELNPDYIPLINRRMLKVTPGMRFDETEATA